MLDPDFAILEKLGAIQEDVRESRAHVDERFNELTHLVRHIGARTLEGERDIMYGEDKILAAVTDVESASTAMLSDVATLRKAALGPDQTAAVNRMEAIAKALSDSAASDAPVSVTPPATPPAGSGSGTGTGTGTAPSPTPTPGAGGGGTTGGTAAPAGP